MRFRNILFPVDFSARSHAAVPHVRAMAEHFGASVTLLHVVEGPASWAAASDGGFFVEFDLPRMLNDADERLAAFAAVDFPASSPNSTSVTRMVEQGDPGTAIAELAQAWHSDLIMLPTHGRGPSARPSSAPPPPRSSTMPTAPSGPVLTSRTPSSPAILPSTP